MIYVEQLPIVPAVSLTKEFLDGSENPASKTKIDVRLIVISYVVMAKSYIGVSGHREAKLILFFSNSG